MTVISTREQVPQIVRSAGAMGLHRPAVPPGAGLTGQDILRILRKRKWLIVLSVLIWMVATTTVTGIWWQYFPSFTAEAYLEIRAPERVLGGEQSVFMVETIDRMKMSLVQTAKGRQVLDQTVRAAELKRTKWWQQDPESAALRLDAEGTITSVRETYLLKMAVTGRNKDELPEIVTAWANAFVEQASSNANTARDGQIAQIMSEQGPLKLDLDRVKREIDRAGISQQSDERTIQGTLAMLNSQIEKITPEARNAKLAVEDAERKRVVFEELERLGKSEEAPEVMSVVDADGLLRNLQQDLVATKLSRDMYRGDKYGDESRLVKELNGRIESLDVQVRAREDTVRATAVTQYKSFYRTQVETLKASQQAIEQSRKEVVDAANALNDSLKKITDLFDQKRTHLGNIETMDRRLLELRMLKKGYQPVVIGIPAAKPTVPSLPRWGVNLPLGFVAGLLMGLGLTFLLELMDTSIKSPSDVSRRVELPLLGMVPHLDDLEEEIQDLRLAFLTNPDSLFGEAFRQIRTTLQFSAPAAQLRSLLVTSALPGDGRTTVSLNLAAATAHSGRRVLVVEANFRQPALRGLFPQAPAGGLSNVLVGQANWKDLVREVHPNLFVLTGGPLPPNPSELLGSDAMRSLVMELGAEYDQVVFDGAPCLLVTDPTVLSTLVDGVVLVVRAGANTYGVVQRARDILSRVGARVFGVVLNGIRVTAGGYLRKNYRTFYEYHAQAAAPEAAPAVAKPPQQLPK